MRVVSGTARGCRLQPVPGMNTRPTTDRVKENVFNLIQEHIRGAQHCDFVEHNKAAYNIVYKNTQAARVSDRAALHRTEAENFVSHAAKRGYDLIFLDPPYGGKILENALLWIERFDILSANGIIICESAVGDCFAHGFEVVRERRYGATMITVLRRQDGGTDEQHENSDLSGQL